MSDFLYAIAILAVVLSFLTTGIYYLWITVIALFPKKQWHSQIPYREDIDMNFFIVIPCLNEESVIVDAVANVLSLGMKQTHVIVVDDDSEDDTVKNLEEAFGSQMITVPNGGDFSGIDTDCPLILLQKRLPEAQQGKGKSLNCAYQMIAAYIREHNLNPNHCVMSVIDADTYINRRVFERVAVIMHEEPGAGMVQTRVRIGTATRDYFLPLMQDIEFYTYINNMQNLREYTGTVAAAGNGQFNRFSAIDPKEPWTECLLEDFDFSLRLLLKGWRTRLLQDDRVFQQGVFTYPAFIRQRARWCQGGIQCIRYWDDIMNSRFLSTYGKIELIYFMLLPTITALSVFTQLLSWFVILWYYLTDSSIIREIFSPYPEWELAAIFMIILLLAFLPGLIYCLSYRRDSRENFLTCLLAALFQPIYNIMQVPATLLALFREMTGQRSWSKTKHVEDQKNRKNSEKEQDESREKTAV